MQITHTYTHTHTHTHTHREFLRFEKSFSDCISTEATRTRFLEFAVSGVKV